MGWVPLSTKGCAEPTGRAPTVGSAALPDAFQQNLQPAAAFPSDTSLSSSPGCFRQCDRLCRIFSRLRRAEAVGECRTDGDAALRAWAKRKMHWGRVRAYVRKGCGQRGSAEGAPGLLLLPSTLEGREERCWINRAVRWTTGNRRQKGELRDQCSPCEVHHLYTKKIHTCQLSALLQRG